MSEENPKGLLPSSQYRAKSRGHCPLQSPLPFPASLIMSYHAHTRLQPLTTSSRAAERPRSLKLHTRCHFFLELPLTTPGEPYLTCLVSAQCPLEPRLQKSGLSSLLCTSNNTCSFHCNASAYLFPSVCHIYPLLSTSSEQVLLTAAGYELLTFKMLTGKKLSHSYQALSLLAHRNQDFPGGTVDKNSPATVGDTSLIPGPERLQVLQSN